MPTLRLDTVQKLIVAAYELYITNNKGPTSVATGQGLLSVSGTPDYKSNLFNCGNNLPMTREDIGELKNWIAQYRCPQTNCGFGFRGPEPARHVNAINITQTGQTKSGLIFNFHLKFY